MGWLPYSGVTEDEIKDHFSQFGTVTEIIRPIDMSKDNTPKNFCFVTFEKERVARKLIEEGTCFIGGHKMKIKQVTPNPRDPWMNQDGGWGKDGGYCGFGGQWGNNRGYGGGMGQGGDQQWGGQGGGNWTTGGRGGGRGGGKMRRGRGMGGQSRPY